MDRLSDGDIHFKREVFPRYWDSFARLADPMPRAPRPGADFADPPVRENASGRLRTVGVEVEFGALSAQRAAAALAAGLGGTVAEEDAHALRVEGTPLGQLMVEIDTRYAHPQRHWGTRWGRLSRDAAARLGTVAQGFVPRELVTGPMPIDGLALVDQAVEVLRRAGAREAGPVAFGLHFNPEPPRLDAATIAAILKAFVLLNDWLRRESRPRRLSHLLGFGRDFPPAYVRRVVAADYWPDIADLMGDYLEANPTRERDLDLLPLFLHLNERRVRARLPTRRSASGPSCTTACRPHGWASPAGVSRRTGTAGWRWSGWRRTGRAWSGSPPPTARRRGSRGTGRRFRRGWRSGRSAERFRSSPRAASGSGSGWAVLSAFTFIRHLRPRMPVVCRGQLPLMGITNVDHTALASPTVTRLGRVVDREGGRVKRSRNSVYHAATLVRPMLGDRPPRRPLINMSPSGAGGSAGGTCLTVARPCGRPQPSVPDSPGAPRTPGRGAAASSTWASASAPIPALSGESRRRVR